MERKNVVILIEWFLPGNKAGGPVKSVYSMIQILKPYFNFSIITTNQDLNSAKPYPNIESDKWTKFQEIDIYYFSRSKLNKSRLMDVIQSKKVDVLYLNSFWSYYFSILPLILKNKDKLNCNIVLAPRGMLGNGALSIKPFKKKIVLHLLKLLKLHSNIVFHATTQDEKLEIKSFFKYAKIKVASNLNASIIKQNHNLIKESGKLKLFFLSRISKVKNLHFALEVFMDLRTEGDIIYDIYGSIEDPNYWKRCEEIIHKLPPNIKVQYKGELSFDQVQSVIAHYHFLFLPTLNENYGHSIAETLKSGCPVIISTNTPWNSINKNKCGYAIPLNEKMKFLDILKDLVLSENNFYKGMSENCVKFMEHNSKDAEIISDYQNLFNNA